MTIDTMPNLIKELQAFIEARDNPRFNMYDDHAEKANLSCVQVLAQHQITALRLIRQCIELILQIQRIDAGGD